MQNDEQPELPKSQTPFPCLTPSTPHHHLTTNTSPSRRTQVTTNQEQQSVFHTFAYRERNKHHHILFYLESQMPKTMKNRVLNAKLSKFLPSSNHQVSICLRDFIKIILNVKRTKESMPPPPSETEVVNFTAKQPPLSTIEANQLVFNKTTTNQEVYAGAQGVPGRFKELCHGELESYGISPPTFQWGLSDITAWDEVMIQVIVKHWLHAKKEGAFAAYALDEGYCTSLTLLGLADRWLRGQKDKHKKPKNRAGISKPRVRQKVSFICLSLSCEGLLMKGLLQIFKHRVFIAKHLMGEEVAGKLLPSIDCSSEIEEDQDGYYQSRSANWRSSAYAALLASLDHHTIAYLREHHGNKKAVKCPEYHKGSNGGRPFKTAACPSLPSNCYHKQFLARLSTSERIILDVKDPWPELNSKVVALIPPSLKNMIGGNRTDNSGQTLSSSCQLTCS